MPDDLTAALEEIRERRSAAECVGLWRPTPDELDLSHDDVPRLLAALRAVLELADKWAPKPNAVPLTPRQVAAVAFREVISRELTGKGRASDA